MSDITPQLRAAVSAIPLDDLMRRSVFALAELRAVIDSLALREPTVDEVRSLHQLAVALTHLQGRTASQRNRTLAKLAEHKPVAEIARSAGIGRTRAWAVIAKSRQAENGDRATGASQGE